MSASYEEEPLADDQAAVDGYEEEPLEAEQYTSGFEDSQAADAAPEYEGYNLDYNEVAHGEQVVGQRFDEPVEQQLEEPVEQQMEEPVEQQMEEPVEQQWEEPAQQSGEQWEEPVEQGFEQGTEELGMPVEQVVDQLGAQDEVSVVLEAQELQQPDATLTASTEQQPPLLEQPEQAPASKVHLPWREQLEQLPWWKEAENKALSSGERKAIEEHTSRVRSSKQRYRREADTHQRPQFGVQTESYKKTEPAFSFGKGTRFMGAKQFISKAHSAHLLDEASPGPAAYSPESPKKRSILTVPPSKSADWAYAVKAFGTEARFAAQNRVLHQHEQLPSPNDYRVNTPSKMLSIHPGAGSPSMTSALRRTFPSKGFETMFYGTESPGPAYMVPGPGLKAGVKFVQGLRGEVTWDCSPGPAAYDSRPAFLKAYGKDSTISFPNANRAKSSLVSLPPRLADAALKGLTHQKGPAAYDVHIDYESRYKRVPGCGLGMGIRFPPIQSQSPGPGSYVV